VLYRRMRHGHSLDVTIDQEVEVDEGGNKNASP
jgi:hypothetical protein